MSYLIAWFAAGFVGWIYLVLNAKRHGHYFKDIEPQYIVFGFFFGILIGPISLGVALEREIQIRNF